MAWSGGKDSTLALHTLLQNNQYEIAGLMTTVTEPQNRISMHGVRVSLLEKQAKTLGLPLHKIIIPTKCDFEKYEKKLKEKLLKLKQRGVWGVAFGDIFLEDIRKYREEKLSPINLTPVFPIWGRTTKNLSNQFIDLGFQSIITCIDTRKLDKSFIGKPFTHAFINRLPKTVDPCGENGEFHSFVFDGPIFKKPLNISVGENKLKDDYCFCDLMEDD